MSICGEEDRFRGEKINIAPLQISTELPSIEKAKFSGHGHHRKDIAEHFRKEPHGNVQYTQLFQEVEHRIKMIDNKGSNPQAIKDFLLRHGNLVVIAGQPGIGKSTLTKRLVEEMWESSLFEPDIVFLIRFREVDYARETDVLQFLAPYVEDIFTKDERKTILEMLSKSEKVFIIMDGLDEATISPKMNQPSIYSIQTVSSAECFIQNIIAANIFSQSKKIVTSRPYRIAQLPKDFLPKVFFTIQGLDESGLKQICGNICGENINLYNKILMHLHSHPDLKSYCHTPVICIMVMESLYGVYEAKGSSADSPNNRDLLEISNMNTLTGIFVFVLKEWLVEKLERSDKFQIKEISDLAFNGFIQDQFYFREFHLKNSKVNFQNNTTFLNTVLKGTKIMYFIHLMWQEFLTSVQLRFYTNREDFKSFLDKLGFDNYEVVTKFLFGLCNKHTLDELLDYVDTEDLNSSADRKECKHMLKHFALQKLQAYRDQEKVYDDDEDYAYDDFDDEDFASRPYFHSILPVLGWIREMGDEELSGNAAACLKDEILIETDTMTHGGVSLLPNDIPSITQALQYRVENLALELYKPDFVDNCSAYFYKELHATLDQNPKIKVSLYCYHFQLLKLNTENKK